MRYCELKFEFDLKKLDRGCYDMKYEVLKMSQFEGAIVQRAKKKQSIDVAGPSVLAEYNKHMAGVDFSHMPMELCKTIIALLYGTLHHPPRAQCKEKEGHLVELFWNKRKQIHQCQLRFLSHSALVSSAVELLMVRQIQRDMFKAVIVQYGEKQINFVVVSTYVATQIKIVFYRTLK